MEKEKEKLNVAAGMFFQALMEENRLLKQRLHVLEKKVNEMETTVLSTSEQNQLFAYTLLHTIQYTQTGTQTDFEKIAWELKTIMPTPEERKLFHYVDGMEFWINFAQLAAVVFPNDPYFKKAE